jgi:hypothetical protein
LTASPISRRRIRTAWCPRNEEYAAVVREAFVTGSRPSDFPDENYEREWPDRFRTDDLNETGRRGLGLAD